jgi:hypothetical protein
MKFRQQVLLTAMAAAGLSVGSILVGLGVQAVLPEFSTDVVAMVKAGVGVGVILVLIGCVLRPLDRFHFRRDPAWPRFFGPETFAGRAWLWVDKEGRDRDA